MKFNQCSLNALQSQLGLVRLPFTLLHAQGPETLAPEGLMTPLANRVWGHITQAETALLAAP